MNNIPRFSLRSLLVLVTAVSLCAGLIKLWPVFGVLVSCFLTNILCFKIVKSTPSSFVMITLLLVSTTAMLVFGVCASILLIRLSASIGFVS